MLALIKLTNGTELIGEIINQNEQFVTLKDPLQINYKQRMDMAPPTVYLHRFNPFSNASEHTFRDEHVLTYSSPLPGLIQYYTATLGTIKSSVDEHINNELKDAAATYSDEESESDEVKRAMMELAISKPLLN